MGLFDRIQKEIEIHEKGGGVSVIDVLELPPRLRKIMNLVMRRRLVSLEELVEATEQAPEQVRDCLSRLMDKGYLLEIERGEECQYRVIFSRKRGRKVPLNVWDTLGGRVGEEEG